MEQKAGAHGFGIGVFLHAECGGAPGPDLESGADHTPGLNGRAIAGGGAGADADGADARGSRGAAHHAPAPAGATYLGDELFGDALPRHSFGSM